MSNNEGLISVGSILTALSSAVQFDGKHKNPNSLAVNILLDFMELDKVPKRAAKGKWSATWYLLEVLKVASARGSENWSADVDQLKETLAKLLNGKLKAIIEPAIRVEHLITDLTDPAAGSLESILVKHGIRIWFSEEKEKPRLSIDGSVLEKVKLHLEAAAITATLLASK